ncbi:hypothetical protein LSH36_293g02005 [Paralvinella palmiformis]|uniref:Neutral ceramidase n=1 Tax=Paralvinella palmiformis TaxID=53620 RepID=A0AAD9N431_9ANNE|nr:hypothetical protein LSH36_293g02005 [Paralvinella palmiformis]
MGYSFGAGATDGPGIYPFYQGMLEGIPEIDDLIDRLVGVPQWLADCQVPKPVLLPTVVTLVANGYGDNIRCIVTAMANAYSSYITTPEEYEIQRYEGASTVFGQYTINGYISEFVKMAEAMAKGEPVDPGEEPEDLRGLPDPALGPVVTDATEHGLTYGDILVDSLDSYQTGEIAYVTFVSGNPRNNLMTERTFLEVQRQLDDNSWTAEYSDAHWETKYIWLSNCQQRPPFCLFPNITGCNPVNLTDYLCRREQYSNVTIEWDIPNHQQPGIYRLVHYGHANTLNGTVDSYTGISREFQVIQAADHVIRRHSNEYYMATSDGEEKFDEETNLARFLALYL